MLHLRENVQPTSTPAWRRELHLEAVGNLRESNTAMENGPFIGDVPMKTSIDSGFSSQPCLMTPDGISLWIIPLCVF